jgi:hypothetical protein
MRPETARNDRYLDSRDSVRPFARSDGQPCHVTASRRGRPATDSGKSHNAGAGDVGRQGWGSAFGTLTAHVLSDAATLARAAALRRRFDVLIMRETR